ncbi:MAG: hypothetical protein ACRCVT_14740 [Leadbetterella sp.]
MEDRETSIVGSLLEQEYFVDMPDCIFEPNDYKDAVENMCRISQGVLTLDSFEGRVNEGKYELDLVINGKRDLYNWMYIQTMWIRVISYHNSIKYCLTVGMRVLNFL